MKSKILNSIHESIKFINEIFVSNYDIFIYFRKLSFKDQILFLQKNPKLINQKTPSQGSFLFYLAKNREFKVLFYILKEFPIKRSDLDYVDGGGQNILFPIIFSHNLELFKLAIQKGAKLNQTDFKLRTVLFYAVTEEWIEGVEYMILSSIDLEQKDHLNKSAFEYEAGRKVRSFINRREFLYHLKDNSRTTGQ